MIDKVRLMAMYLPQYHEIPENNEFWGKGFTDWTTVKSAKQYFKQVQQPKVPLDNNYYDLSNAENIRWQVKLAKQYGIDGFVFYHYWFSSKKQLLQTPAELFLKDKENDINFCFDWDNEPWKRSWDAQEGNAWSPVMDSKLKHHQNEKKTLVEFDYEDEIGWKKHFDYLLPFFKDSRYIKIDNKPVFMYCNYYKPQEMKLMAEYWDSLAKENGFNGICLIGKYISNIQDNIASYSYMYQPHFSGWENLPLFIKILDRLKFKYLPKRKPVCTSYKYIWKRIISQSSKLENKPIFYGAFVNYDDSPRRGEKGRCVTGKSVKLFKKYLQELINLSKLHNKEYVFITAWNEWGEGAYLEPDSIDKYDFLEVVGKLNK